MVAGAAATAFAALIGLALASRLSLRLRRAAAAAERVTAGDMQARVAASGRDEVAALGEAMDRMAESLQTKIEHEQRFVANVAHDLRTPLTGLIAAASLLEDDQIGAVVKERSARLHELVEDLLEISRLENGAVTADLRRVDLAEFVRSVAAGHEGVTVIADGDVGEVLTDPRRVERVLDNLLHNAARHGAPPIEMLVSPGRVDVLDSGPGFTPDMLTSATERFSTGRPLAQRRRRPGAGHRGRPGQGAGRRAAAGKPARGRGAGDAHAARAGPHRGARRVIRLGLAALAAGVLGAACGASGNGLAVAGSSHISTPPPASSTTVSSGTHWSDAALRSAGRLRHPPGGDRVGGRDRLRLGHAVGGSPAVRPPVRDVDPDRRRHRQADRRSGAAAAVQRPLQAGGGRRRVVAGRRAPGVADRPRHRPAPGHAGRRRPGDRDGGGVRLRVGGCRDAGRRRAAADRSGPGNRRASPRAGGGAAVGDHGGRRAGVGGRRRPRHGRPAAGQEAEPGAHHPAAPPAALEPGPADGGVGDAVGVHARGGGRLRGGHRPASPHPPVPGGARRRRHGRRRRQRVGGVDPPAHRPRRGAAAGRRHRKPDRPRRRDRRPGVGAGNWRGLPVGGGRGRGPAGPGRARDATSRAAFRPRSRRPGSRAGPQTARSTCAPGTRSAGRARPAGAGWSRTGGAGRAGRRRRRAPHPARRLPAHRPRSRSRGAGCARPRCRRCAGWPAGCGSRAAAGRGRPGRTRGAAPAGRPPPWCGRSSAAARPGRWRPSPRCGFARGG